MDSTIRNLVSGAYDIQKLRIQAGNRVVANFKAKLGQQPGQKEEEIDDEGQKILALIRLSYDRITDGVKSFPRQSSFKGDELISSYTELCLIAQYIALDKQEAQHFRRMANVLETVPIYRDYLANIAGCGPAMSGVLISEIDIAKAKYPSSLWAYAGLDVAGDGRGRGRFKDHLTTYRYTNKSGEPAERQGITFNPFLKTKLFVLATCFIKIKDSPYRAIYDGYKHRLENHPAHIEKSKGHRHSMAMRYMVKRFLADLHVAWRTMEGLPVATEYSEGKLGYKHAA